MAHGCLSCSPIPQGPRDHSLIPLASSGTFLHGWARPILSGLRSNHPTIAHVSPPFSWLQCRIHLPVIPRVPRLLHLHLGPRAPILDPALPSMDPCIILQQLPRNLLRTCLSTAERLLSRLRNRTAAEMRPAVTHQRSILPVMLRQSRIAGAYDRHQVLPRPTLPCHPELCSHRQTRIRTRVMKK